MVNIIYFHSKQPDFHREWWEFWVAAIAIVKVFRAAGCL